MPKDPSIRKILVIGSGPIVIGQGCEFDYSGVQACKALKEEGCTVVLINSNPATIMTDPEFAARTYIEPITPEVVEKIIAKERPDALLPTLGGQTALNTSMTLHRTGVLEKYGVRMIGAKPAAIEMGEDRQLFKEAMIRIGLDMPKSGIAHTMEEARRVADEIGTYPLIIRPAYTLGGAGGGIAYNKEEFETIIARGLDLSPVSEVLIEESLLGWKEFEMEVVRDRKDNCIIVCSIENLDPMGVHTGDSITVAPAQTLTDKEYQLMRDASIAVLREVGVDTGGSNVQFAINPADGRMVVIEMNPRVSRSSALASKATGFPIAKIAAKLAVGYTLDELSNDITGGGAQFMPASFEPTIDYVVTKVPRFAFEKFRRADDRLTTQMKSVGEVMAIGRTFKESLQKALRGLEVGVDGFNLKTVDPETIADQLAYPRAERLWYVADAFGIGMSVDELHALTKIDPWFLAQIKEIVDLELALEKRTLESINAGDLRELKRTGFADRRLAHLLKVSEKDVRERRHALGIRPVYKRVDTCAAEFATRTAYMYSTYEDECEAAPTDRKKVMVLGGGPNRIGQGIEFDYCCVHAAMALREDGFETIMVNCNPETVSTDYDTSDRLYFEPLTLEDVLEIVHVEKPWGVIVQFGGQTPLKLARELAANGVPIMGTSPDMIDVAEDRERFAQMLHRARLRQPPNRTARTEREAMEAAEALTFPLVVRPSYVLGGRAMEIVHDPRDLERYMKEAVRVSNDSPVLLDRFLNDAIEVDVDAVSDGGDVVIGGIMEHIEQAGVHSGDSACSLPPYSLSRELQDELRRQTVVMAKALRVVGLMNVQFAIQHEEGGAVVYVLEVNPRASRTVPYVSKATGRPLASIAARCMAGRTLAEQGIAGEIVPTYFSVKEAVFPFIKFPGVDTILGPEMKSTGEVMGVGETFAEAFLKSQLAAGVNLPESGNVFISLRDADKARAIVIARKLHDLGYGLIATRGTAAALCAAGVPVTAVNKVAEGRPHIVDMIVNGEIALVVNTVEEKRTALRDSYAIRRAALNGQVPTFTTLAGARAAATGMEHLRDLVPYPIQELHARL
jgi:carbamoyl-phosphate synthase large subunit